MKKHKVMMTKAVDKDTNELIDIKDVGSGEQHQFVCLCHGGVIVARKGDILKHHFGHKQGHLDDINLYNQKITERNESLLHKRTKEILSQLKTITIPRIIDFEELERYNNKFKDLDGNLFLSQPIDVAKTITLNITNSEIEKDLMDIIPDVLIKVENKNNDLILENFDLSLEVRKSHAVDTFKAEKYRNKQLYSIEIDVSSLSKKMLDDDFDLDKAILEEIRKTQNYKYIYFPLNHIAKYFLEKIQNPLLDKINEVNKKILEKRENVILWATEKEENNIKNFVHVKKAEENIEYKCSCCNGVVKLNTQKTNFIHLSQTNCSIFMQSKLADLFYQQELFAERLFQEHKKNNFYLTEKESYPFKLVNKKQDMEFWNHEIIFTYHNEQLDISLNVLLNFDPNKELFDNNNYLQLSNFKNFKNIDLRNIKFNIHFGSEDANRVKSRIKQLQDEEEKILLARIKEQEMFNKYPIFYDNDFNLVKKQAAGTLYKCLFCKSPLTNFQHENTNLCKIFDKTDLDIEYGYILRYERFDLYFQSIENQYIELTISETTYNNILSSIDQKYLNYLKENKINHNSLTFKIIPKNYKKIENNILISFEINNKIFDFLIDCGYSYGFYRNNSYQDQSSIIFSKELFKNLIYTKDGKNHYQELSYLFKNASKINYSASFNQYIQNLVVDNLENNYGKQIQEKIEFLATQKAKEDEERVIRQRKEAEERKLKLEDDKRRMEQAKAEQAKRMLENKIIKEKEEKERKDREKKLNDIEKKKKPDVIKSKIAALLGKNIHDIVFESGIDKKDKDFRMEYFIADNILFLNNGYYDCRIFKDYPASICYIIGASKAPGYKELFKKTDYILVINEEDLLLDNINFNYSDLVSTELFKDIENNGNKIMETFRIKEGNKPKI